MSDVQTGTNPVPFLRTVAFVEAVSFLLLLGVAMPLKYLAHMPMPVKVIGWAHGALFILLCFLLMQTMMVTNWSLKRCAQVFIASLLPFGPFVLDRRMAEWEREPVAG